MFSEPRRLFSPIRVARIIAFLIDIVLVAIALTLMHAWFGFPDFPSVLEKMRAINATAAPDPAAVRQTLDLFGTAYFQALAIYFFYEVVSGLILNGQTPGKLAAGFRLVPSNSKRGRVYASLMLILRSALKMVLMYLLQGIPFFIAVLHAFADDKGRAGYDRICTLEPAAIRQLKKDKEIQHA